MGCRENIIEELLALSFLGLSSGVNADLARLSPLKGSTTARCNVGRPRLDPTLGYLLDARRIAVHNPRAAPATIHLPLGDTFYGRICHEETDLGPQGLKHPYVGV